MLAPEAAMAAAAAPTPDIISSLPWLWQTLGAIAFAAGCFVAALMGRKAPAAPIAERPVPPAEQLFFADGPLVKIFEELRKLAAAAELVPTEMRALRMDIASLREHVATIEQMSRHSLVNTMQIDAGKNEQHLERQDRELAQIKEIAIRLEDRVPRSHHD